MTDIHKFKFTEGMDQIANEVLKLCGELLADVTNNKIEQIVFTLAIIDQARQKAHDIASDFDVNYELDKGDGL
jgi:hypothetical protein